MNSFNKFISIFIKKCAQNALFIPEFAQLVVKYAEI